MQDRHRAGSYHHGVVHIIRQYLRSLVGSKTAYIQFALETQFLASHLIYMFGSHLPIWLVIVVETVCAFVLAVGMGSPLAFKLASRKFDPRRNHPMIFESAVITATVCLMCPSMSLLADAFYYPYYEGFNVIDFMCRWFRLVCYNLPFAYFSQMFFVQPFVRFAIRRLFPTNIAQRNERNATKTVKPTDETEAIADVIIREKEIAAGK